MTRAEIERFLLDDLRHRLPWLVPYMVVTPPGPQRQFISPVEFVRSPIGPIMSGFALNVQVSGPGAASRVNGSLTFTALFTPGPFGLASPLRRWKIWWRTWLLRAGAEASVAEAIAHAVGRQWQRDVDDSGSVRSLLDFIRYDAPGDDDLLELRAYLRLLIGDRDGAAKDLAELGGRALPHEDGRRVAEMGELIRTDTSHALERLREWRVGHLEARGLTQHAVPWDPSDELTARP